MRGGGGMCMGVCDCVYINKHVCVYVCTCVHTVHPHTWSSMRETRGDMTNVIQGDLCAYRYAGSW